MPDHDFDFEPNSKTREPRRRLPAARVLGNLVTTLALGGLAFSTLAQRPGTVPSPWGPYRAAPSPMPGRPFVAARPGAGIDPRFIHPAPPGIDERMIVAAPSRIDEAMIVAPGRLRASPTATPRPVPMPSRPYFPPGPVYPPWGLR